MQSTPLRQIAIIGPTASGKSSLAYRLARKHGGVILSLDSLSLYRHIDIASAKPPRKERDAVPHYGIDVLEPDETFDVTRFAPLYRQARTHATRDNVPLFIVGGSSFYLKILLEGISSLPEITKEVRQKTEELLTDLPAAYRHLRLRAPRFAKRIPANDRYRIEKGLLILLQTGEDPVDYFEMHPPKNVIREPLPLFEITWPRETLRNRIRLRTEMMLEQGLLNEVSDLEFRYGRKPQSMKAIGIAEVLDYFDGRLDYATLKEKIITHTARLAKRQQTFNRGQFSGLLRAERGVLEQEIDHRLNGGMTGFPPHP